MRKINEVWVFDVCGTLFSSNTTFDFLEFFFKRHDEELLRELAAIKNKNLIYWWRAILFRFFHIDLFKKKAVYLLRNFEKSMVELEAEKFLIEILDYKKIEKTNRMLKNAIQSNSTVLLASNSIEPVVKAIARQKGVNYFATSLGEDNGVYTGLINRDLTGRKHQAIGNDSRISYHVVTDNKSDYRLVKIANKRFVVIAKASDRKFWNKLSPEFIIA